MECGLKAMLHGRLRSFAVDRMLGREAPSQETDGDAVKVIGASLWALGR